MGLQLFRFLPMALSRWPSRRQPCLGSSTPAPFYVQPLLQVAEQIRAAQQKAALSGQAPAAWAIGARCEALYAGDGQWYSATVKGVTGTGNFLVSFDEYGTEEEVGLHVEFVLQVTVLSSLHVFLYELHARPCSIAAGSASCHAMQPCWGCASPPSSESSLRKSA